MSADDPLAMIDEIMQNDHTVDDLQRVKALIQMAVESRIPGSLDALDDLAELHPDVFDPAFCAGLEQRGFELGLDDALARRVYDPTVMGEEGQRELFEKVLETAERYGGMALSLAAAMYMDGLGTERDPAKAMEYARRAKAAGNAGADSIIAELLLSGEAGEKDPAEAVSILTDLALDGDATAMYDLGRALIAGTEVERDESKGLDYLLSASEAGYVPAVVMCLDLKRSGTPMDLDPVKRLDELAREGQSEAAIHLAQLYVEDDEYNSDTAKAEEYLRMGAEAGSFGCIEELVYRIADDTVKEEYEGELYDLIRFGVAIGDEDLNDLLAQIEEDRKKAADVPSDD